MKLFYSGIAYEKPSLALDAHFGEIRGKDRSQNGQYHYPSPIPRLHFTPPLTYRGVTQHNLSQSEVGNACPMSLWEVQKVVTNELSQMHFENIRKSLEKRLQVAEERGDVDLIQLLNREFEQLVTFS
jgi:hypothetical protein